VIPSVELGYMFDSREFTTLLRFWLGQAVYDAPRACPGCGVAMDVFGYHALTCSHLGGLGVRHNKLRDVWLRYFKLAGIPAQKEAPSLLPGSAARPADIFVPHFLPPDADTAKQACLDFAVTHPQQPSTLKRAGEVCGYSANEYAETVKEAKFGGQCTAAGVVLVPMVVETFGRWDSRADEVFAFVTKGSGAGRARAQSGQLPSCAGAWQCVYSAATCTPCWGGWTPMVRNWTIPSRLMRSRTPRPWPTSWVRSWVRVASVLREMSAPARGVYVLHDPTNFPSDMTLLGFVRIWPQFVYIPRVIVALLKSFVLKKNKKTKKQKKNR